MRQELQSVLEQARTLVPDELPDLLGDLEIIRAVAYSRLASPAERSRPDEPLDVATAATRMGISPSRFYKVYKDAKFVRREGRKLIVSSAGLESYLKKAR
jgi:hypothetical protein